MSGFEIVERGAFGFNQPLGEGEVAIGADGRAVFRRTDLELVGIDDLAIVLADTATLRIGLRKPRAGEAPRAMAVGVVKTDKKTDSGKRAVSINRALKRCALDPRACRGRLELVTKDDLLILNLANVEFDKDDAVDGGGRPGARGNVR